MRDIAESKRAFARFAWGVLAYNVAVVLWGGFVRATGSGAGCGGHWPLCNGDVVPRAPTVETIIEFTHRLTSGLSLVLVATLLVWSFRLYPGGHRVRRAAVLSAVFLVVEALLGAGLVLFNFVAHDASAGRAVYLSAHLVNTQLLLATLAGAAWFAGTAAGPLARGTGAVFATLPVALALSVTGALAALGDTLFPAASVAAGLRQELASGSSALLRLRMLHPVVAALCGGYVMFAIVRAIRTPHLARAASAAAFLLLLQFLAGTVNVALLAPVWMQIVHLLLADLFWIALVLLYLRASHEPAVPRPAVAV
jgi:heme A synthase